MWSVKWFVVFNSNVTGIPDMVQCLHCGVAIRKKNIHRHIAAKHTQTEPSVCTVCNRTFKSKWSLKEHERTAHGILQSQKDYY